MLLEQLEDRLSPAANLLVTTTIAVTEQVLREFTPSGRAGPHGPPAARQTAATSPAAISFTTKTGKVHVYTGTFDPALEHLHAGRRRLDATARTPAGARSTTITYGGIGLWGDYVYATDMATFSEPADEAKGVVRFNLADGTSARFLETEEPQTSPSAKMAVCIS